MKTAEYLNKLNNARKNASIKYVLFNTMNQYRRIRYVCEGDLRERIAEFCVYKKLQKKYSYVFDEIDSSEYKENPSDKIWTVWLQGYEYAPELSKVCISSVFNTFQKDKVTVITMDNISDYIDISENIINKWKKGIISYVHLADYIQISLLAKYGGTWFDATVLVLSDKLPSYFLNNSFFTFSNEHRNSPVLISSWFMSSYSNSKFLNAVRRLLETYWEHENGAYHYLILHLFVRMAIDHYPDVWNNMPKFSNIQAHMLAYEIFDKFDPIRYGQIKDMCPIQKLSNKFVLPEDVKGTNYEQLIVNGYKLDEV